jgi:hypothetical protein
MYCCHWRRLWLCTVAGFRNEGRDRDPESLQLLFPGFLGMFCNVGITDWVGFGNSVCHRPAEPITRPAGCSARQVTWHFLSALDDLIWLPTNGSGVKLYRYRNKSSSCFTKQYNRFSPLAAGNYNVTTTVGGCTSNTTALTVNAQPKQHQQRQQV